MRCIRILKSSGRSRIPVFQYEAEDKNKADCKTARFIS